MNLITKKNLIYLTILAVIAVSLLIAAKCFAHEWVTTNQATIAWDASTELQGNVPIPETDTVEYKIVLLDSSLEITENNMVEVGTTEDLSYVVSLADEGSYYVGVYAVRKLADGTVVSKSTIAWSYDPDAAFNGETFGLTYYLSLMAPSNLRPAMIGVNE